MINLPQPSVVLGKTSRRHREREADRYIEGDGVLRASRYWIIAYSGRVCDGWRDHVSGKPKGGQPGIIFWG